MLFPDMGHRPGFGWKLHFAVESAGALFTEQQYEQSIPCVRIDGVGQTYLSLVRPAGASEARRTAARGRAGKTTNG